MNNGDKASEANRFIPVSCYSCYEFWNPARPTEFGPAATAETETYRPEIPRYQNIMPKHLLFRSFLNRNSAFFNCYDFAMMSWQHYHET
jgi:hypothetical protein